MANSDDLYTGGFRGRGLYNIRGSLKYGNSGRIKREQYHSQSDIDKLSQKRLVKHFLCDGENSECVVHNTCECLKVCLYGQRYLQTLSRERSDD